MSNPRPTVETTAARISHLDAQLGNVATQLSAFISESKSHRERVEADQAKIWTTMERNQQAMNSAIERISTKGQITWPVIVMTIGMILGLVGGASALGNSLMESRIRQVEIRAEASSTLRESHIRQLEIRQEFLQKELDRK